MGKFPGKWIKTHLLGKKASKSSLSEGREVSASGVESAVYPPLILRVTPGTALEKGVSSNLLHNDEELPRNQDPDAQGTTVPEAANGPEGIKQEQAATKAQSAFRGFLARRAFRALKGIIRLQALIRGHLVRRQAAATLCCMKGIVRFQAVVRGRRVRISDAGLEVQRKCNERRSLEAKYLESIRVNIDRRTEKLLANAFGIKLLASITTATPVRLEYGANDPNSAWNWLEHWTSTRFWEPLPPVKKSACAKPQARQRYPKSAETVPGRSKHNVRKVPAANGENGSTRSTTESEKPKRGVRKVASHPKESVQKHPQTEHEKVKRTLRKSSSVEASDQVEAEIEKPKRFLQRVPSPAAADTSEEGVGNSSEKIRKDTIVEAQKIPDMEATQIPLTKDEPVENTNVPNHDEEGVQGLESSVLSEAVPAAKGELNSKEDPTDNGNQKNSRRALFPAKQEYPENGLENTLMLPSYMAATASAKAKLRAQGSPRYSQDGVEKDSLTRRHSLPSFPNGKLNSLSPRAQKLVHESGKGGVRDRTLLSLGDGKLVQAEWRR